MYTSPSNIIKAELAVLNANAESIDAVVKAYEPDKTLTVLEGMRKNGSESTEIGQ